MDPINDIIKRFNETLEEEQNELDSLQALAEHVKKGVPLCDSLFRYQSEAYFDTFLKAKKLREAGALPELDWESEEMLSTDIGESVQLKGIGRVWLDVPYLDESNDILSDEERDAIMSMYDKQGPTDEELLGMMKHLHTEYVKSGEMNAYGLPALLRQHYPEIDKERSGEIFSMFVDQFKESVNEIKMVKTGIGEIPVNDNMSPLSDDDFAKWSKENPPKDVDPGTVKKFQSARYATYMSDYKRHVQEMEEAKGDIRRALAGLGVAGALAMGGNAALDATSAKHSPLGKELAVAAQQGDQVAAYHLKNLDLYTDANDQRTLVNLKIAYVDDSPRQDVKAYLAKKAGVNEALSANMQNMFDELRIDDNTNIMDDNKELTLDEIGPGFYLLGYDRDGSCFEMSKISKESAKDSITGYGEYKVADADITDFDGARYYYNENMPDSGVLNIKKPTNEAEYNGKKVQLNKPKRGGSKKYYVYVKNPKTGRVKKISFGDVTGLKTKSGNKKRAKSFAARHNCEKKNDKMKAGYWACRLPRYGLVKGGQWW